MYWSYGFLFVFFYAFAADSRGPCENNDNGCCSGQEWNETLKTCTDCKAGYTGRSCSIRCQYPYYGMQCQMKCSPAHTKDQYDFKRGCVQKDLTTLGEFLGRTIASEFLVTTNTDEGSTKSFTTETNSPSEHQADKAISSGFPPLQILLIALSALLFIFFAMYLLSYKIAKPGQIVEPHSDKTNAHYEDIQDLEIHP